MFEFLVICLLTAIAVELGFLIKTFLEPIDIEEETEQVVDKINSKLDRLLQYDDGIYDMTLETKNHVKDILNSKKNKKKREENKEEK